GELWREAEAHGVATSYRDWHGRRAEVGEETLRAVLAAMGETPRPNAGAPGRRPLAAYLSRPRAAPLPSSRSWGFTVQLYSLRSRRSWGHGDLRDLADLAAWSARELGAGFVLIHPLHAAEPATPPTPPPSLPPT